MEHTAEQTRKEIAIVLLFSLALSLLFINEAFTIDEPFFLAIARQILRDPLHPLNFQFNWFDKNAPMAQLNTYPLILPYILSIGMRLTGASDWGMRLFFVPFDLIAASSLYLLAARYLKRPLWPTLIILAGPAYLVNMQHLMAEKWIGAFGFSGLYALFHGSEKRKAAWYWASTALLAMALLIKPSSIFLIFPAIAYQLNRRARPRQLVFYFTAVLGPTALYLAWASLHHFGGIGPIWHMMSVTSAFPWSRWPHRLRSTLAFTGTLSVVPLFWPFLDIGKSRKYFPLIAGSLLFSLVLFSPRLDWQAIPLLDRVLGFLCTGAILFAFARLFDPRLRRIPGWEIWISWIISLLLLQIFVYWLVASRFLLFIAPPLIIAWAAHLETIYAPSQIRRLYALSFAAVFMLGISLACVDASFADGQREIARLVHDKYIAQGKRVWFTGHWGFQYYMEQSGAVSLDQLQGGWGVVRSGDIVVAPTNNASMISPEHPVLSNVVKIPVNHTLPLRLTLLNGRQAGFYASIWGFLPFTLSTDAVDEFAIIEIL